MRSLIAVSLVLVAAQAQAQVDEPFVAGCPLPFVGLAHPIDSDCGIEGKSSTAAKRMESRAKNNLCATGSPTWVTFFTFKKLKEAAALSSFELGADRGGARNIHKTNPSGETIGEGSLVRLAAFVLRADIANKSGGEAVNCSKGGIARNDVHIHLAETSSKAAANFCKAVVAEIIPHQRPDDLNAGDLILTNTETERHPVRITGQLFFDGNHPIQCSTTKPANSRGSTWEIHPVYKVDVCKNTTLASCDARDDSKWKSLEDYISGLEDEHDEDND